MKRDVWLRKRDGLDEGWMGDEEEEVRLGLLFCGRREIEMGRVR